MSRKCQNSYSFREEYNLFAKVTQQEAGDSLYYGLIAIVTELLPMPRKAIATDMFPATAGSSGSLTITFESHEKPFTFPTYSTGRL